MSAYAKINEDAHKEEDVVLQLNATPLDLNWNNLEEFDEDEDGSNEDESYDEPGTSGINLSQDAEAEEEGDEYEEDDEEVIDLSADMEPTTVNLFKLNIAYQEVITRYIAHIDQLLHHIAFKKLELDMIVDQDDVKNLKKRSGGRIGMVIPPYFGDFFNPGTPNNPDKTKIREIMPPLFQREVTSPSITKWTTQQKNQLKEGICSFALKAKIQPLVSKIEYIMEKHMNDETSEITEKINATKEEIEQIKMEASLNPGELMGDLETSHDWEAISNISLEEKRTAVECKVFWKNNIHPSINKSTWTTEEDDKLLEIVKANKERNWPLIAKKLQSGRTPLQCIRRYQNKLNKGFKSRPWEPEEDIQFLALAKEYRVGRIVPFHLISTHMKNRTYNHLLHHWNNSLNPSLRRARWTAEEDVMLLQGIAACGQKWSVIRDLNFVPGRNDVQLRERFANTLNLHAAYAPWDVKEDEELVKLHAAHGNKWVMISKIMKRRSDSQCLKRFKMIQKARELGKPVPYPKRPKYLVSDGIRKCRDKLIKTICKNLNKEEGANGGYKPVDNDEISKLKIKIKTGLLHSNERKRKHCEILNHKILREIEKESDISETIKIYEAMLKFQEEKPKLKAPKLSDANRAAEIETMKLLAELMQPIMQEANIKNTNINKMRENVKRKTKNVTAKNIFCHYLKKLNVDAKETIEVMRKSSSKNTPSIGDVLNGNTSIVPTEHRSLKSNSEPPIKKQRAENKLYLDLCAPSRATVKGFKVISNFRDQRKRSAKTIIQQENTEKEKDKYTIDELLQPIQATQDYKMFRSRFVSLFTWPCVLASIIPSNRSYPNGLIRPIMTIKEKFLDQMYVKNPEDLRRTNR